MTAGIVKRSLSIAGHRTSITLEEPFWLALRGIAQARGVSIQRLVGEIDAARADQNLSSAIRVFVLHEVRREASGPSTGNGPIRPDEPGSAAEA